MRQSTVINGQTGAMSADSNLQQKMSRPRRRRRCSSGGHSFCVECTMTRTLESMTPPIYHAANASISRQGLRRRQVRNVPGLRSVTDVGPRAVSKRQQDRRRTVYTHQDDTIVWVISHLTKQRLHLHQRLHNRLSGLDHAHLSLHRWVAIATDPLKRANSTDELCRLSSRQG